MKRIYRTFLDKLAYVSNLHEQVRKQGEFPAGHYYSPIPSEEEVLAYIGDKQGKTKELPGIALNEKHQFRILLEYCQFYEDLTFPEEKKEGCRYYYENGMFSYADSIFLYCFLRRNKPKRIVEVGSGFSSAVILDSIEGFFPERPEVTFIDPYPHRLRSLLTSRDEDEVTIIDKKIQEVPVELFSSLQSGDLLFIDSSHVVKCNSDLNILMFDVLPQLPPGVFVHFHDVFYPFDYPSEWLKRGRYWNENYFLRAFLSYNCEWDIHFYNGYVAFAFNDVIKERMPLCIKNPGGSLYLQRVAIA